MDEKYYGKIVSKNLKRIMYERNKTQADMCRDLKPASNLLKPLETLDFLFSS